MHCLLQGTEALVPTTDAVQFGNQSVCGYGVMKKRQMWIWHSLRNLSRPHWVGRGCSPVALCFGSILFCLCCCLFLLPFVCSFHLHGWQCLTKCLDHADAGYSGSVSNRTHQTGCVLAKVHLPPLLLVKSDIRAVALFFPFPCQFFPFKRERL